MLIDTQSASIIKSNTENYSKTPAFALTNRSIVPIIYSVKTRFFKRDIL